MKAHSRYILNGKKLPEQFGVVARTVNGLFSQIIIVLTKIIFLLKLDNLLGGNHKYLNFASFSCLNIVSSIGSKIFRDLKICTEGGKLRNDILWAYLLFIWQEEHACFPWFQFMTF